MNLGTNAIHSFNGNPGSIEIQLTGELSEEEKSDSRIGLAGRNAIRLSVKDNGCGMDASIMERIFDPFYTTKELGEGTGLGLSVVHGIVEGHDGRIIVESQPGQGSLFNIYLPVFSGQSTKDIIVDKNTPRGTEHILMVDDEQIILDSGKKLLESLGYKVTTVNNPEEAIELFKKHHKEFDLLLSDQAMPKMSGSQLVENILAIDPEFPVIIMTGYSRQLEELKKQGSKIKMFIKKPMELATIGESIRKVLDQ